MTTLSESEFFNRACEYLRTEVGRDTEALALDRDLIADGVLDSLLLLSFLYFLEGLRGDKLAQIPDFSSGFTLRGAYEMIRN
jgi:hypothetical protein